MVLHENVPEINRDLFLNHIAFLRRRARVLPAIVANCLLGSQLGFKLGAGENIGEIMGEYL